ncbi:MAG TPA: ABC transporter ATP-binding protein [Candidatus Bathyarchaeia archaeon]|nr:ABC transporter ATP-binding protein [Candidatus Bathyarchaeia archaeon]
MAPDTAIEFEKATVRYHRRLALDEVSLSVGRGEFVGIIGPNGAGKTTLLKSVNGLVRLWSGRVGVLGLEPHNGAGHRVRKRVGYLPQAPQIDSRVPLAVRDTVLAGRWGRLGWLRRPGRADREAVERALVAVGAAHLADRPVGKLSGGEYQRVALARVLAQEPDVFLFDEPTAGIDPQAQLELLELIRRVHAEREVTALYVTHHIRLEDGHAALPECCTRLLMMRHGRIWRDGPRGDLADEALLRELYHCCSEAAPLAAPHAGGGF